MCGPCKRIRFSKPDLRDRLADSTKERWYNNIVLSIPHASVGGLGIARWDNKVALLSEVKRWTDWYTDLLFIPDNREGIQFITSDYSRFVVDVERLVNDPLDRFDRHELFHCHRNRNCIGCRSAGYLGMGSFRCKGRFLRWNWSG